MATREVLALNEATPQIEAAQSGDTYLFPRAQLNDATLYIKEGAAAAGDIAAYGQLWTEIATPNLLKFTDDAGTDWSVGVTLVNEAGSIGFGLNNQDAWTSGTNNVSLGADTLGANTTGANNVAVGKDTLNANITGNQNVAIGTDAGGAQAGATDDDNTFIGFNAGLLANGGTGKNTVVGSTALDAGVTSNSASAFGYGALGASTANGNDAFGDSALAANIAGVRNAAFGQDAGTTSAGATDNDNTFLGFEAGKVANGSASGENTAVGSQAAVGLTSGVNNTVVGNDSAASLTTGDNNIVIGSDADCVAATDNQVSIGTAASVMQVLPVGQIRRSITAAITANAGGGGVGSATALTTDINEISVCATGGDSVNLPSAIAGLTVTIINNGAAACDVFPFTTDDLGGGVDTAVSLGIGANITYVAYTAALWVAVT